MTTSTQDSGSRRTRRELLQTAAAATQPRLAENWSESDSSQAAAGRAARLELGPHQAVGLPLVLRQDPAR